MSEKAQTTKKSITDNPAIKKFLRLKKRDARKVIHRKKCQSEIDTKGVLLFLAFFNCIALERSP